MTGLLEPRTSSSTRTVFLLPRREPTEHGLLAIPTLMFPDPAQRIISVKQKPVELSSGGDLGVSTEPEQPTAVDLQDLLLFLYIQSYKRVLARTQKHSVAVGDVWPSTSAFDGYLSALWPLQFQLSLPGRNLFFVHCD